MFENCILVKSVYHLVFGITIEYLDVNVYIKYFDKVISTPKVFMEYFDGRMYT